jgi:TRAP-type C4-dicarboxylate transport system permease small subunit
MEKSPVAKVAMPISRFCALVCGWWLLAFSVLTCVDIVGRKLFNVTLQGTDEIGGYTMAVVSAVGFSYALLNRSHTRIDIVLMFLSSRSKAILSTIAAVTISLMAVYSAWRGWAVLQESISLRSVSNSPLQIPMWLPQGIWVAGLILFACIAVAAALHALRLMFTDYRKVNFYYGPPTIQDEIDASGVDVAATHKAQP